MTETPETLHRELLDGAGYCRFCWYQVKNEGHAKDCIGAAYAAAWEDDGINYRTRIVELEAELNDLRKRLEAAEEGIRTAHSWFGSVVAYADIETNHAALVGYIREWMRQCPAALAGEEKPQKLGRDVCRYPDWEGGLIVGEHVWGKDGTCCVCGEEKP